VRALRLVLVLVLLVSGSVARAQSELSGEPDELAALEAAQSERWVRARELATRLVRRKPGSYIGHYVLGLAQHEGEANFPVALREEQAALDAFERRFGRPPSSDAPWRWHAMILRALIECYGSLERHDERLQVIDRYNERYVPQLTAERAWSLMKLRRFEEARLSAREAIATNLPFQVESGLNALCAVEFEAGQYGRSYAACREALEFGRQAPGGPGLVDITNFAESARTELHLAESIELLREATTRLDGGFGNPYLELGELLIRGGRIREALDALREVPRVRETRPPARRESDRNESMRALISLYLVLGRPADASRISSRALVMPDRRGHNSRDPDQDRAIVALLDRAARRLGAGAELEAHAGGGFWESLKARARSVRDSFAAWQSGRRVVERLRDERKLVGILQIGTAQGGISPSWLVSDLVDVFGPGVMRAAVTRARATDRRPLARGYYDEMEAEARFAEGQSMDAARLARAALATIPVEDALLRARAEVVLARAQHDLGRNRDAGLSFERALAIDPSILRRMDVALPARVRGHGAATSAVVDRLEASGRFDSDGASFVVDVSSTGSGFRVCLRGPSRGFGCSESRRARDPDSSARTAVLRFYATCLAPGIVLTPTEITALEGATRSQRSPLDQLLPAFMPPPEGEGEGGESDGTEEVVEP